MSNRCRDPYGWRAALRTSLTPRPGRWAVGPGLRAVGAACLVLALSPLVPDPRLAGIAYLGVACTTNFIGGGDYRSRAAKVVGQALGAAIGMTVGALVPGTPPWVVAAAAVVGVLAGVIGRIGPASTAGAVMVLIGIAYTQFDRLAMPWWEPVLAYLVGSALVLALSLVGAPFHRDRYRRAAVAAVFAAAADVVDAGSGAPGDKARGRLATESAAARVALAGYRVRPERGPVVAAWSEACEAADRAARAFVGPEPMTAEQASEMSHRWRALAEELRIGRLDRYHGAPASLSTPRPAVRVVATIRAAAGPEGLRVGARIGVCMGLATALAILLHPPQHAFWIPLTVAVVLRPEYGAVTARSVHRLAGTLAGIALVGVLLSHTTSQAALIVAGSLAQGLAGFAMPRFYGLAVIGITGSALLSVAIADPTAAEPVARMLDTLLGCAIVVVAGVVLWPRRGLPDQRRVFGAAVEALARQIEVELRPDTAPSARAAVADEAYRAAHAWRGALERDLVEPDPRHAAAAWLPVAIQLEHTVDAVRAALARTCAVPVEIPTDARAELAELLGVRPTTPVDAARMLSTIAAAHSPECTNR